MSEKVVYHPFRIAGNRSRLCRQWLRQNTLAVDGELTMRHSPGGGIAGDLVLAQSEGMEPQNFLQLAHGQPFLWQRGFSTYQWSPPPRLPCAAVPIPCRSLFRTTAVISIGFSSEC